MAHSQTPTQLLTPPIPSRKSEENKKKNRDEKALGSRERQGNHLPVTIVGKTDSTSGKLT